MNKSKRWVVLCAVTASLLNGARQLRAVDTMGLTGEFTLPDRLRNLVDSQDEYFDAVQRLQDAQAAVLRARESAMKDAQSSGEYQSAVKAVEDAYQAYTEKKNALVVDMEKKDPVYNRMKSQVADIDAQIDAARLNPATTQQQLEDLYKNRETFQHQCQQLEDDSINRAGIAPLKQAWVDASKKLSDLSDSEKAKVEETDRLKSALAEAAAAKAAVEDARNAIGGPAPVDPAQPTAGELLCRISKTNFAGNDAWWTYGWTHLANTKPGVASSPAVKP